MELPLLIAREENRTILPDDYKLGWLFEDTKEGLWIVWGSFENKEFALHAAKEVVEKQGKRDVFLSDIPISRKPTKEQIASFETVIF